MIELEKNPNPTKDQHFMIDKAMLEKIYESANIQDGERVVEIGGGEGALTDYLVKGDNLITVIEKDPYYANYLKEKYKDYLNVTVIEGDALTFDFSSYDRVVANLPYTITEPFLINLSKSGCLDYNSKDPQSTSVKSVTLVLSQNSVRKMVAPIQITEGKFRHANSEFGIMGAICKTFCDVEILSAIPSSSFYPEPAVTSFLVNLTPKKEKTTVDRIMREFLIDKKGNNATIEKLYQLMICQEKVYKTSKHKNNMNIVTSNKFTSPYILCKNIYDLNNMQVSQLIQDLIRNDMSIKSKNSRNNREFDPMDIDRYFVNGKFVYKKDDYDSYDDYDLDDDDLYDDDCEYRRQNNSKHMKKYDYFFDSIKYDVLSHRGLEFISNDELQSLFNNTIIIHKTEKKLSKSFS